MICLGNATNLRLLCFQLLLVLAPFSYAAATETPVVAAASSLQFALPEIAARFTQHSGHQLKLVFGSSGNFVRQIRQGAPFALYLSADESYTNTLIAAGLTRGEGVIYAHGRLSLAIPPHSPLKVDTSFAHLKASLSDGSLSRFAIANPEHAPYGERAMQALQHQGLWEEIQSKLVFGENVGQAAQFALSSNAQGGIIAQSQALSPTLSGKANYALIPDSYHEPLRHRMVLLTNSGEIAELFYRFIQQSESVAILEAYGFEQPD